MTSCSQCGACCVAPDISSLGKPMGVPCKHLGEDLLCTIYDSRPAICRSYQADSLCDTIAADTLHERVERYLEVFGFEMPEEVLDLRRRLPLLR